MLRVLQFSDIVNRYDFIDTIVQWADPERFAVGVCVRTKHSNIAPPIYTERTPHWVLNGTSRRTLPQAVWQLACLLRQWNVDILHTHHYNQALIGWLATRTHPKTRLIVGRHYSDAIYRLQPGVKRRAFLGLEQVINRAATRIIAPSRYVVEILTTWQGVHPDKVDCIPYGFAPAKWVTPVPCDLQRVRDALGLNGRFVLSTFGRLDAGKGHRFLLEAIALLKPRWPSLSCLIVGEGPERRAIEQQLQEAGLHDVVQLLGWRRDAMTLMAAVDAVVQPTLHEAFSSVMSEALWTRKPLIITDVGGATDIIRDGENGLLVPRRDAAALAHAIERLADDATLRARLSDAGRKYVGEHLIISKVIHRYEQSYLKAMEA